MKKTGIYTDPVFGLHETPAGHPEQPARYGAVVQALEVEAFAVLPRQHVAAAPLGAIERVHEAGLVSTLGQLAAQLEGSDGDAMRSIDPDTHMGPHSYQAALRACGAAISAVDDVISGAIDNAFVAARPPGHHAEPDRAMGFCLFNAAAIAARHAMAEHGLDRVAIVDFDVHHGNGTQAAVWDREQMFFASSHEWPQYPGTGAAEERGGYDNVINVPLPSGTRGNDFRRAWGEEILPALDVFDPSLIVISAGFDAHAADPLGGFGLLPEDFGWVTREIRAIADIKAGGRVVSLLEGGYNLEALGQSVQAHVAALADL